MNTDNALLKDYFLNDVTITSDIRAKGEYKYFYIGENSSETDKSFLYFSTMWYTEKITKDMEIISSCYNPINTAQLFYNKKTKIYSIFIYKNKIDNRNENISLKLHKIIKIAPHKKNDDQNSNPKNKEDKDYQNIQNSKIFLASFDYILLNENDTRILLININTGKYITIFSRSGLDKDNTYNIFDTYDESFIINGEQKIRTYVFLTQKIQDRKTPTYRYCYFMIQRTIEKNIHLFPINLDLGNSEPIGLKIAKIIHRDKIDNEQKCFFIICFLSTAISLQLITDYDNVTLHQMFQKYCKIGYSEKSDDIRMKRLKFWINKSFIKIEKIQYSQGMNVYLNISNKKLCALMYYFEMKGIISYLFNYTDPPEVVSKKIFLTQKELNLSNGLEFIKRNDNKAKIYLFRDCYQFKNKCHFGYSDKNLLILENNSINIYEENYTYPIFSYEFYDETLTSLMIFENIGYTFILTEKKLFKIIYNDRYKLFDNDILFTKNKIHYYKYYYYKKANSQDTFSYPSFEYKPEDIWNAYCKNLNIPVIKFPEENFWDDSIEKDEEEEEYVTKMKRDDVNYELENYENVCALCNVECELVCSHCGARYYCCYEHFRYDYFNFHFFECQLIQFFQRKDIMKIKNLEIRYKILYNELIKMAGRILNFIFTRIFSKTDYPYFLNMILILINIFTNFGFLINLSDFYLFNLNLTADKRKFRHERCMFYLESIFYFVQLNLLKCTFTLRGGLYNLTDCYIKMIKSDIAPKLTPKANNRFISLKIDKMKSNLIFNNKYFSDFNSQLFFDLKRYTQYLGESNSIDIAEEYILYHLKSLSLLAKFKIKIHSTIEVHNLLVDMILMFDDHYSENFSFKNIVPYCYFSTSFYLVEIGKIAQTVKLLRRMVGENFEVHLKNRLYALTYFNLGLLQYSIGQFDIGIHNIEIAFKIIMLNDFSDKIKFKIIDSLGLAYLNQKNLYKAYILIQKSIKERKKMTQEKYLLKINKLYVYLNYIVDLYEYNYISKARNLIETKYKNEDQHKLIKFILGEEDKELVISEQNLVQFIKVVEFIWKLDERSLKQLNADNPPKAPSSIKEEIHHEKNFSFNSEISQVSSFILKDNLNEKNNMIEEYEEDIEVKVNLYDSFSRQQQLEFKDLKTIYLKRDIVLRDSLGNIEKFNINFDPIFADEFQKIIEKLKVNFLLKDIFYCFQNEKWRDELYNYNQNNILFGLSKYLKLEKIQNMMAIEKSKNIENRRKELQELKDANNLYEIDIIDEEENYGDSLNNKIEKEDEWISYSKEKEEKEDNIYIREYNFNRELSNIPENQKNKMKDKNKNMSFNQFKHKFKNALKQQEKENTTSDLLDFIMDPNENYLYILYKNVYKNNPDKNFIFQNPLLILNYIFIDINNQDTNPIIGRNNKLIKSVITNVKEEDDEYSFDSKNKNKEENLSESPSDESSEKSEENINISKNKKNKNMEDKEIDDEDKKTEEGKKIEENILINNLKKEEDSEEDQEEKIIDNFNIKDESSFKTIDTDNKKQSQNFIIVSKQATYIFIPDKKISDHHLKEGKRKSLKNPIQKKLSVPNHIKFNLVEDFELKQNSTFVKEKQKEATFIEKIDKYFNYSIINNDEEEENKKTFALIKMKNRNLSLLMKSHNNSSDTSNILGKRIKEDKIKNKEKKKVKNFLLASIQTKRLWDNEGKNNKDNKEKNIKNKNNMYKKINNNKVLKEKKRENKKPKKDDLLINQVNKDVEALMKKEAEKTYLRNAKIRNMQKNIKEKDKGLTFREEREKNIENEVMKLINSGYFNKNKFSGFNMYMNNIKKKDKNEEKKENIKNKSAFINSYVNMNYNKIKAKRKKNEIKEEIEEKTNKNKLGYYEQEKEKILKFNSKLINKKLIEELQMNDTTKEDDYFNINHNSNIKYKQNKLDENSNYKNFIFDPSNSYINNINGINTSNNYKKIINRNNEMLSERNTHRIIQDNTTSLIRKYKLFPFLNKNDLLRSKENSLLNSLSNTNTQTSRKKKKKIDKNVSELIKNANIKKYNKYINKKK